MKQINILKKKRARTNFSGDSLEQLAKELPVDGQIGYNLLRELLEEDSKTAPLNKYTSNTLACISQEGITYALYPTSSQRGLSCMAIELKPNADKVSYEQRQLEVVLEALDQEEEESGMSEEESRGGVQLNEIL